MRNAAFVLKSTKGIFYIFITGSYETVLKRSLGDFPQDSN